MIARQMVDMLVESSSNVEMILKFFDMFLKLKDIVGSEAFQDYVTDPRGLISKKDFQKVGARQQVSRDPGDYEVPAAPPWLAALRERLLSWSECGGLCSWSQGLRGVLVRVLFL
jgi:hypothetical protein